MQTSLKHNRRILYSPKQEHTETRIPQFQNKRHTVKPKGLSPPKIKKPDLLLSGGDRAEDEVKSESDASSHSGINIFSRSDSHDRSQVLNKAELPRETMNVKRIRPYSKDSKYSNGLSRSPRNAFESEL